MGLMVNVCLKLKIGKKINERMSLLSQDSLLYEQ